MTSKRTTDRASISGAEWEEAPGLLADLSRECDAHANLHPDSLAAMAWELHEGGDPFSEEA